VQEAAQSRDGSIETKWIASVSPGSDPSTKNGAGLRVHERELDHAGDVVIGPANLAAERILGPELEDVAGRDPPDGRDATERPRELRRVGAIREHAHQASSGPSPRSCPTARSIRFRHSG
jgi:hypothetical protein